MDYNELNNLLTNINDEHNLQTLDSNKSKNINTLSRDMEIGNYKNNLLLEPRRFTENSKDIDNAKNTFNNKITDYNFSRKNNNNIPFFDHKKFNISTKDIVKENNNINNKLNSRDKLPKTH